MPPLSPQADTRRAPSVKLAKTVLTPIAALILTLMFSRLSFGQQVWSMGYETPWGTQAPLSDIDMTALTHIIHVGGSPQSDGSLILSPSFASKSTTLISLAHAVGVKVLFSLGDTDSFAAGDFNGATTNHLSSLITNTMNVVNTYGYDGVDIDWETSFNGSNAASLFSALRTALGSKLLTAADSSHWNNYCKAQTLVQYLDRIDVMSYDQVGPSWSIEWFNAPLYRAASDVPWSVDYMIQTGWIGDGCSAAKLNVGLPFYGYTLTGGSVANSPRTAYGGTLPTQREIDYSAILATYDVSHPNYDTTTHAYWLPIAGGYLTFDSPAAIKEKVQYVKENNLGGVFFWNLNTDWVANATPKHLLLDAVKQVLRAQANGTQPNPPTNLTAVVK